MMAVLKRERDSIMREIVNWLRAAPEIEQTVHSAGSPVGLVTRKRSMTAREAADELERQIARGVA